MSNSPFQIIFSSLPPPSLPLLPLLPLLLPLLPPVYFWFFQEDGSGAGGYAKEMSKEWFEAAERMLAAEMKSIDVVIGTALIPGRPAPRLITEVYTGQGWGGWG